MPLDLEPIKERAEWVGPFDSIIALDLSSLIAEVESLRAVEKERETGERECPNCNGTRHEGSGMFEDDFPCRTCCGAGRVLVSMAERLRRTRPRTDAEPLSVAGEPEVDDEHSRHHVMCSHLRGTIPADACDCWKRAYETQVERANALERDRDSWKILAHRANERAGEPETTRTERVARALYEHDDGESWHNFPVGYAYREKYMERARVALRAAGSGDVIERLREWATNTKEITIREGEVFVSHTALTTFLSELQEER